MPILIVDDSSSIRQTMRFLLEEAGFEVDEATDGAQGLALAEQTQYELILSDVNMLNMDGLELTKRLRASKKHKHTPILLVTTEASDEMKAKGKALGATGWLVKPVNPQRLIQICHKAIG